MRVFINAEDRYRIQEKRKIGEREKKFILIERTAWGSGIGIESQSLYQPLGNQRKIRVSTALGSHKAGKGDQSVHSKLQNNGWSFI